MGLLRAHSLCFLSKYADFVSLSIVLSPSTASKRDSRNVCSSTPHHRWGCLCPSRRSLYANISVSTFAWMPAMTDTCFLVRRDSLGRLRLLTAQMNDDAEIRSGCTSPSGGNLTIRRRGREHNFRYQPVGRYCNELQIAEMDLLRGSGTIRWTSVRGTDVFAHFRICIQHGFMRQTCQSTSPLCGHSGSKSRSRYPSYNILGYVWPTSSPSFTVRRPYRGPACRDSPLTT